MRMFSVAVTLASSSRSSAPASRRRVNTYREPISTSMPRARRPVEVRIQSAPSDHVAARRGKDCAPVPGGEGTGEQDGGADPAAQGLVQVVPLQTFRAETHRGPMSFHLRAQVREQFEHDLDVLDPRHVVQHHRLRRSAPHAASMGRAAFLLPTGWRVPERGRPPRMANRAMPYSTVTLLARLRGLSMSVPRAWAA